VYGVVAKRRGKIVAEEMKEGASFFTVRALLPVVESFGFADGGLQRNISGIMYNAIDRHPKKDIWSCESPACFQWVSKSDVSKTCALTGKCDFDQRYVMLDEDPFWVPTTEEELEDLGDKADRENIAKGYMDKVRERKGMFVKRKIVETAEKQRTLKR
jgi:ribosome assembly protein 1